MRDKVFALIGVEPGDESAVSVLLIQSVCLGIFFGTFDISAHSLFLSIFDEKMMAKAYVLSGITGIILISLYNFFQAKSDFRSFAVTNLFTVTLLTLLLWTALMVARSPWTVFMVFITLGPLNMLAAMSLRGNMDRLLKLSQRKRLSGLVGSWLIAGIIISCLIITVLLLFDFKSRDILLISVFSGLAATILQELIRSRFSLLLYGDDGNKPAEKKAGWSVTGRNRFITVIAVFLALSVMVTFFVQYSFMAVVRRQYHSEESLAMFLALFTGSMMIFTLLLKKRASHYLVHNYGIRITMIISPVVIALMAVLAVLAGYVTGYTTAASGVTLFFVILTLSRFFSRSLKDSIETSSLKIICQIPDDEVRREVQPVREVMVNEIAVIASGLILSGLGMFSFIKLIHFPLVLFIIALAWMFTALLLYSEYRKSVSRVLETKGAAELKPIIPQGIGLLKTAYEPPVFSGSRVPHTAELLRFLRDNSIESKRYALYMIGKFRLKDMLTEVCNCLGNPSLEEDAASVLLSFGRQAVTELQRYNMTISGNVHSSASVLRIMSKIPCHESSSFLFSRLSSPSKLIKEAALKGLLDNSYVPDGDERKRLNKLICDTMVPMAWNLAARNCFRMNNDAFMVQILDKEIARWEQYLFSLLSLTYGRSYIDKIEQNLEKDTGSANIAMEMIDIIVDESVKPRLIALLDPVADEDKLKKLRDCFPCAIHVCDKLAEDIINRDYNLISIWTKVSILRRINGINEQSIAESVSALLFSSERIICEEAARLLARSDMAVYRSVSDRISYPLRNVLDRIAEGKNDGNEMLYEKVLFLSGLFAGIPEDQLLTLSEHMVYMKYFEPVATCNPDCIVWNLEDERRRVYLRRNGETGGGLPQGSYYMLPFCAVEQFGRRYPESTGELLMYINSNELQN